MNSNAMTLILFATRKATKREISRLSMPGKTGTGRVLRRADGAGGVINAADVGLVKFEALLGVDLHRKL